MHPANDLNVFYQNQVDVHPAIVFNVFSIQCNIQNSVSKPGPCNMKFSYQEANRFMENGSYRKEDGGYGIFLYKVRHFLSIFFIYIKHQNINNGYT